RFGCHRLIKTVVGYARPAEVEEVLPLVKAFAEKLSLDQAKDNPVDKFPWVPYGQAVLAAAEHLEFEEKGVLQNNLGLRLSDLGDYAGAKTLLEKALASDERNFGEQHPTTA
ncbi:tetratricopeptide repeat protein, partial [Arthrospira platensis SPKY1]|nr:tetratricopeptide repeat protein [Arthrospira platensis SPKY1]